MKRIKEANEDVFTESTKKMREWSSDDWSEEDEAQWNGDNDIDTQLDLNTRRYASLTKKANDFAMEHAEEFGDLATDFFMSECPEYKEAIYEEDFEDPNFWLDVGAYIAKEFFLLTDGVRDVKKNSQDIYAEVALDTLKNSEEDYDRVGCKIESISAVDDVKYYMFEHVFAQLIDIYATPAMKESYDEEHGRSHYESDFGPRVAKILQRVEANGIDFNTHSHGEVSFYLDGPLTADDLRDIIISNPSVKPGDIDKIEFDDSEGDVVYVTFPESMIYESKKTSKKRVKEAGYQTFINHVGEKDSFYDPYKKEFSEPDMDKEFDFEVKNSNPKGTCATEFGDKSPKEIEDLLYDSYHQLDYLENNLYDVQKEARLTYDWDSVKEYKQRIANEEAKFKKLLDAAVELSIAGEEFSRNTIKKLVSKEVARRDASQKRAASKEANRGNRIQKYADELKNYYDGMPEKVLNLLDDNGLFKERKSWGVIKDYFNTPFGKHLKNLWVNQFGKKESKMKESIFSKRDMSEDVVDYLERHQAMELVEDVEFVIPSYGAKSKLKIKINKEKLKDKAEFLVRFTKYGIDPNEEGWEPSVQKLGYLLNKAIDFDDVVTETNNVGAFYLCLMNPKTNRHLKESRMKEDLLGAVDLDNEAKAFYSDECGIRYAYNFFTTDTEAYEIYINLIANKDYKRAEEFLIEWESELSEESKNLESGDVMFSAMTADEIHDYNNFSWLGTEWAQFLNESKETNNTKRMREGYVDINGTPVGLIHERSWQAKEIRKAVSTILAFSSNLDEPIIYEDYDEDLGKATLCVEWDDMNALYIQTAREEFDKLSKDEIYYDEVNKPGTPMYARTFYFFQ